MGVPYRTSKEEAAGNNTKHLGILRGDSECGGEPVAISLQLDDAELKKLAQTLDACTCDREVQRTWTRRFMERREIRMR